MKGYKKNIVYLLMSLAVSMAAGSVKTSEEKKEEYSFPKIEVITQKYFEEPENEFTKFFKNYESETSKRRKDSHESTIANIFKQYLKYKSDLKTLIENFPELEPPEKNAALIVAMIVDQKDLVEAALSTLSNDDASLDLYDDSVFGFSPAQCAVMLGKKYYLELLFKSGADVNDYNKKEHTLLMLAILNDDWEMVSFILHKKRHEIDLTWMDNQEMTAWDHARKKGNPEIIAFLRKVLKKIFPKTDNETKESDKSEKNDFWNGITQESDTSNEETKSESEESSAIADDDEEKDISLAEE